MILTETHIIPKTEKIDTLLFKSKNLYNNALYHIKQSLLNKDYYKTCKDLEHKLQSLPILHKQRQNDYYSLPGWSSQVIVNEVWDDVKQSFKDMKDYLLHPTKYKSRPHLPNYKHTTS